MANLALFLILWLPSVLVLAQPHDTVSTINQAQQEYQHGRYWLALDTLSQLDEQQADVQGLKGLIHYRMRHFESAETLLNTALKNHHVAKSSVPWLMALAEIHAQRGLIDEAKALYQRALLTSDNQALSLSIQLGQIALLPVSEQLPALNQLQPKLIALAKNVERSRLLLNMAAQAQRQGEPGLKLAYDSYQHVLTDASTQDTGLTAASLDGLAQLYENQQRYEEAYRLNQDGLAAALEAEDEPLLIMLEWRHGRLANTLQRRAEAISAYQNAIQHIAAIRKDIPVEYHNGRSSFRELLEPVYLGLADLLLQQARDSQSAQKTHLLKQARETVELIKLAELEDYLGGRCGVQSRQAELDHVLTATTAVVYPILLPERLELLVGNGAALEHVSVNVSAAELQQYSQTLREKLTQRQWRKFSISSAIAPLAHRTY
ncbi:tetratricopeptide repeat protein [Methylocucumis oryzae]|uniref:Tetratricopeptide repeat protein n=1 Tax=Methylocucumis oryzae TaxID=1632867 RepID=A0A0F3IH33_9GAMM|nr:hypothetical protein [Methylocucumis oryzae]KJV06085.1 hypothetical protein VZ94_13560 [Methylocucumis oryzae]